MKVSKNKYRGALIEDINELVGLAEDRESVVVKFGRDTYMVRPAAFIIQWPLAKILNHRIFHAIDKPTKCD